MPGLGRCPACGDDRDIDQEEVDLTSAVSALSSSGDQVWNHPKAMLRQVFVLGVSFAGRWASIIVWNIYFRGCQGE